MTVVKVRQKYLDFFKARGHAMVPSASLVPENDPTTLFTGSGMQPLIPYLLGERHPLGRRVADSQKCFRAEDIDEVGDNRHTTFFEMLGNWSFGDPDAPDKVGAGYWKEDQLGWFFEFLTKEIGIKKEKLAVSCFEGDPALGLPRDDESAAIWKKLGIPEERIHFYGAKKNWWSRSGLPADMPAGEPGGPDSEVFYEFESVKHDAQYGAACHPNCDCGRFMEIGNSVFMEYRKTQDGKFEKLPQRNVDFGGGLERITAAANDEPDMFEIDAFSKVRESIFVLCHARYEEDGHNGIVVVGEGGNNHGMPVEEMRRSYRVILDHIRSAAFLIADGILPGKTERGYLVRRLVRRAVRFCDQLKIPKGELANFAGLFVDGYEGIYASLKENRGAVISAIGREEADFRKALKREGPHLTSCLGEVVLRGGKLDAETTFQFVTTYGVPIDYIKDEAKIRGVEIDEVGFQEKFKKHQNLSRTASAGTFKGGLADASEKTTRLHTAHHLLLKALQIVLGPEVKQRGSNITQERLRLDFSYGAKMTDEQKKEAERIVNQKIAEDLPVIRSEMSRDEAEKLQAEHEFGQKYPDRVSVYSIGPKGATAKNPQFDKAFSIEFCGGPHVARTGEIGKFKIAKEEAVAAGIRRVRGVLE